MQFLCGYVSFIISLEISQRIVAVHLNCLNKVTRSTSSSEYNLSMKYCVTPDPLSSSSAAENEILSVLLPRKKKVRMESTPQCLALAYRGPLWAW